MNRFTLLQKLIEVNDYQNFLEIGTHKGKTFLPLKCKNKTAVDPNFKISIPFFLKCLSKDPSNIRNHYYSMTSDSFFTKKASYLEQKRKPDLIFIDGLHTFEASLKDVLNSLRYIDSKGTIVLHDCFPPTKASATPAISLKEATKMDIPNWEGSWCGDVWKTIAYLKKFHSNMLDIIVLNTDLGLGIIKLKVDQFPSITIDQSNFEVIDNKDFDYLMEDPEQLIGLREKCYFQTFIKHN